MGKPISAAGGVSSPAISQPSSEPVQQSPSQSPTQSPLQSQPKSFWPPAYGWRLSALGGDRAAHNG